MTRRVCLFLPPILLTDRGHVLRTAHRPRAYATHSTPTEGMCCALQGIMNLLFTCELEIWKMLDLTVLDGTGQRIAMYDYFQRDKSMQYTM